MEEYKGFKVGDKIKHKFREKILLKCEITKINKDQLPLIEVLDLNTNQIHLLPYMDMVHL